jgi:hypothetical protein
VGQEEKPERRSWDTEAERERKQAYRERQRAEARALMGVLDLVREARAGRIELTTVEEQRVRDHFGYAASETRTLAQRDAVARRMVASGPQGPLSKTAFPHVQGRDPESSWTLVPTAEKLAKLHPKP